MNHGRCLRVFQKHAIAVIIADPNGRVLDYSLHGALDEAPIKLVVLALESLEGRLEIVGEIGVSRGHPWRSNHRVANLPAREPEARATEKYLAGTAPLLMELIQRITTARVARWTVPVFNWRRIREWSSASRQQVMPRMRGARPVVTNVELPRCISIGLDERDSAIVRLFEELEWLNPTVRRRIEGMAAHLDALTRRHRRSAGAHHPGVQEALHYLQRPDNRPLLRPHILGSICRFLCEPGRILEILLAKGAITQAASAQAAKIIGDSRNPALRFRILPPEAETWDVLAGQGLWTIMRPQRYLPLTFAVAKPPFGPNAPAPAAPRTPAEPQHFDPDREPDWIGEETPDEETNG